MQYTVNRQSVQLENRKSGFMTSEKKIIQFRKGTSSCLRVTQQSKYNPGQIDHVSASQPAALEQDVKIWAGRGEADNRKHT